MGEQEYRRQRWRGILINLFLRPQSTAVGTTVFRGIQAHDIDAGVNGLVEYFIVESQNETLAEDEKMRSADGYGTFAIAFPHQGQVSGLFFQRRLSLS